MAKRSQGSNPVQIDAESPDRAELKVILTTSHKIGQGFDQEGARDGTGERLQLGHKLWDIRKTGITMNKGDNRRQSLQLSNSLGRGQGQEKEHLLGEGTQRSHRKRFKGGGVPIPQNQGEVPSRRTKLAFRRLQAERPEQVTKHRMSRERRKLETKNRR